jgi:hypothetical protein
MILKAFGLGIIGAGQTTFAQVSGVVVGARVVVGAGGMVGLGGVVVQGVVVPRGVVVKIKQH